MATDKRIVKALQGLKDAMHQAASNPYVGYTLSQLEELVEEVSIEMDRLPSYAHTKLKQLKWELEQLAYVIELHKQGIAPNGN